MEWLGEIIWRSTSTNKVEKLKEYEKDSFHPCEVDPECPYCDCAVAEDKKLDWSFLDAVYCISLHNRNDRAGSAMRELHRVGLCRLAHFFRPVKKSGSVRRNIWNSHTTVAQEARRRGHKTVLILEDDVLFDSNLNAETVTNIGLEISQLPKNWMVYYLGHWPLWSYFIRPHSLRTNSVCMHAYIVNERMLDWLCENTYDVYKNLYKPKNTLTGGKGIDVAVAKLGETYAYYPMIAIQSSSPNDHIQRGRSVKEFSLYGLKERIRNDAVTKRMRTGEKIAVLLAPITKQTIRMRNSLRSFFKA